MPVTHDYRQNAAAARTSVDLDRDLFMRDLIGELASGLENVVGLENAEGYISVVGQTIGAKIDAAYRRELAVGKLDRDQVTDVLVDLKRRIDGDFFVISADADRIVLGNNRCPFGDKVSGRPSMCMMTSNVFGHIAAQNLGYADVQLEETIANGNSGCRVVIHLKPPEESYPPRGREYVAV